MTSKANRQQDRAIALLAQRGMARLSELTDVGITAATISRMEQKGEVVRLARGLYQLPNAPLDASHSLAEAAKLVPKGVICLQSALAYHDLTDRIPPSIWMAIGFKDWRPRITSPPIQIMRFGPKVFASGIEEHTIEGVTVRIYGAAKTIVDEFRSSHKAGVLSREGLGYNLTTAIEALRNALRQRKATPAEIARFAVEAGPNIWEIVRPYLEALTVDA
jgi:predicted transcriptional regulator of viral defense system